MPLALSGTLTDGLGNALADAKIIFQARTTSLGVLQGITAIAQSDQSGNYSLSVELGTYDIYVQPSTVPSQRQVLARNLAITAAVTADDLNGLIVDFQGQEDVTPEIIVQFQSLTAETRGYRDEAAASATAAANDEAAADQHRIDAEAARDSAVLSGNVYEDAAAGLLGTSSGDHFVARDAAAPLDFLVLYRNDGGSATALETYPTAAAMDESVQIAYAQRAIVSTIEQRIRWNYDLNV